MACQTLALPGPSFGRDLELAPAAPHPGDVEFAGGTLRLGAPRLVIDREEPGFEDVGGPLFLDGEDGLSGFDECLHSGVCR